MPTKVARKPRTPRTAKIAVTQPSTATVQKVELTGEALISFVSGTQTNVAKATFYNLADEQRKALIGQHIPVLQQARAFYTLMALPEGVNDVNKQMIAWNIIENTMREKDLKPHEHSPMTMWENEVLLQAFSNMQPNRVFDFIVELKNKRVTKNRAMYLAYQWLLKSKDKLEFWAIKYRKDIKNILKHLRHNYPKAFDDAIFTKVWDYLRYDKTEGCGQIILDYVAVQNGDKDKLAKLPHTVAEGFKKKFSLSDEQFEKLFEKQGGTFTAKEKRVNAAAVSRAGASTGLDIRKLELFDLLVYLKSQEDNLPESVGKLKDLIDQKAKQIASKMLFSLDKVGLILDNSLSMFGTKQQAFHPMFRAMAISQVLRHVSTEFKEYRTNEDDQSRLFPKLYNQSNYGDAILRALKDGCNTLVIVGDGYENAPYEGFAHEILFDFKQSIDKNLIILHFNPVFASETMDVRALSNLAPQIGVREVKAMNESMFLAIAKQKPVAAIQGYMKYLVNLQNDKAKQLMPADVKKIVEKEQVLLSEAK